MATNTQEPTQLQRISGFLNSDAVSKKFKDLLGKKAPGFITSIVQAVSNNDLLKKASLESIYGAATAAAVLDLPVNNNLGLAYIVPYKNEAQFQIGYKGIRQLALRTGEFVAMNDSDVREGEIKSRNRLTGAIEFEWIQDETERLSKKVIGYVSYFRLVNGFENTHYMTVEELEAHAKQYSQTYKRGYGLWKDDFDKMARKTVVKLNLQKNAPLSIETELSKALVYDQAKVNDAETLDVEYVDNTEDVIDLEDLRGLYMEHQDKLTEEEQVNAERILKNEETSSYNKLVNLINERRA